MFPFIKKTVAAQIHLMGLIAAVVGLFILLRFARLNPDFSHFWACLIFGVTGILVFAISTFYHFMKDGFRISTKLECLLEDLDHFAIYLFIAGTYTPFILNAVFPPWRHILLWMIWSIGFGGILYTCVRPNLPKWAQHRFVNTALFVLMGWVLVIRLGEAFTRMTALQAFFLSAGGVIYTIGAVIYAIKKPNPFPGVFGFHEIWHVMVLFGGAFHYLLILDFYS